MMILAVLASLGHSGFSVRECRSRANRSFAFPAGAMKTLRAFAITAEPFWIPQSQMVRALRTLPNVIVYAAQPFFRSLSLVEQLVIILFCHSHHLSLAFRASSTVIPLPEAIADK